MQNAGQTPAILTKVLIWVTWGFGDGDRTIISMESKNDISCHRGTPTLLPFSFEATHADFESKGHLMVIGRLEYTDIFGDIQKEPFSWRTKEGHFMPLNDHNFPIQLAAFSPLSMLDAIEQAEAAYAAQNLDEGS